jgi:hypothetical protein
MFHPGLVLSTVVLMMLASTAADARERQQRKQPAPEAGQFQYVADVCWEQMRTAGLLQPGVRKVVDSTLILQHCMANSGRF